MGWTCTDSVNKKAFSAQKQAYFCLFDGVSRRITPKTL
nr:MAG TPA: hypothetical protein [Caudoviricetes sp.]